MKMKHCKVCKRLCDTPSGFCSPGCSLKINYNKIPWNKGKKCPGIGWAGWNKGLNKSTNEGVKKISDSLLKGFKNGRETWNKGNKTKRAKEVAEELRKRQLGNNGGWSNSGSWCKGKTKENDIRLKLLGEKSSKTKKEKWKRMTNEEKVSFLDKVRKVRPTKPELKISEITPDFVEYVGDNKFWIRLKNRFKNPDFIVKPFSKTKKVIEVFGSYWHKKEDEISLLNQYKDIGIKCLIIWDHQIKKDLDNVKKMCEEFIAC